jgi:Carboxypeptidase regulatory-like domain
VLDADGKGREGVDVRAIVYRSGVDREHRQLGFRWSMLKSGQLAIQNYVLSIESARTGADGSFAFESVPGDDVEIAYWGERVPEARVTDVGQLPAEQRERLELRIPKPGSLKGRLNREAFPAVAHLQIGSLADPSFGIEVPVRAGQDRYEVPDLPPGGYELLVAGAALRNPDGTFHFPFMARAEVEVAAGESRELDLGFGPAFAVAGRVTVGRRPMAGGTVALFLETPGREILRTTKTDADGRYRFTHVPSGRYALVATGDKPVEPFRTRKSPERKLVDVKDANVEQAIELADPAGL